MHKLGPAFDAGVEAGRDRRRQAGECPFDHTRLEHRSTWMEGFALGRKSLEGSGPGGDPPGGGGPARG